MRWMNIEPIIQSKSERVYKYGILTHIWNLERWYQRICLQGINGEIETRVMNMERGEKRVRYMETVTWKLTLPYVE